MQNLSYGILPGSQIFFHTASETAKNTFFYPLCAGHFYCDSLYEVSRSSYESFLLLYVVKGEGTVISRQEKVTLKAGDLCFLDCYLPHEYRTSCGWEIQWLHLDGPACRAYYEYFYQKNGSVLVFLPFITGGYFKSLFSSLLESFHAESFPSDAFLSKKITDLLTLLLDPASHESGLSDSASWVAPSIAYIRQHFTEEISIEFLAARSSLSHYHFIRQFKKETGKTPHQFLLHMRISSAKFYLRTTSSTIQEIAYHCGFKSENNFCICFKNQVQMTPGEYRRQTLV